MADDTTSDRSRREQQLTAARALGSPARVAIVDALRLAAPRSLSRSQIRRAVPDASHALSYHLTQLVEGGWIVATGSGAGARYEAVTETVHWSPEDLDNDPELRLAQQIVERMMHLRRRSRSELWNSERDAGEWPASWVNAESNRDYQLQLTPHQLDELDRRLCAVVDEFRDLPLAEDSEWVMYQLHGFPFRVNL